MKQRAAVLAALVVAGCGGEEGPSSEPPPHPVPPRPQAAGPDVVEPAPRWVTDFCAEVTAGALCPAQTPPGLEPSRAAPLRPGPDGYVLEGTAARRWAIVTVPKGDGLQSYRPFEVRGVTRVRGRAARWLGLGNGLVAGHVALFWSEGDWSYAITARGDGTRLRAQIRRVADGMS